MNSVEIMRWKQFSILTLKLFVIGLITILIVHGFSLIILMPSLKVLLFSALASFFWVFCARDENG